MVTNGLRDLGEHVAVVTGGGRGIGRAIARRLAGAGAAVVVNGLSVGPAEAVAAELRASGARAIAACGDVADEATVAAIFAVCRDAFGPCTLLVNNAGHEDRAPFEELSVTAWDRMIAVHLRGAFLCARAAVPDMLAGGEGVIVNIVSRQGQRGGAGVCHYAAAKAGIIGLTKSLALEFSRRGIRVNAVAPGPVETGMADQFEGDWRQKRMAELPLGHFGTPDDVADTVAFLASPQARLYVGQTLAPNCGGLMLG